MSPTKTPTSNRLLTAEEVAERWSCSEELVHRLARNGKVTAVRVGRFRRFRQEDIDAFEREGGVPDDDPR